MITFKECKDGNEIRYEVVISESGKKSLTYQIHFSTLNREIDGKYWLLLYDSNFIPISETFEFLNYALGEQSVNTRIKAMEALKFLYSFRAIISKELGEFSFLDINNFRSFLKGISPSGPSISMELQTKRNNETINGYMAVYRNYYRECEIKNTAMFATRGEEWNRTNQTDYLQTPYRTNFRRVAKSIEVPWYISAEEFSRIIDVIRKKYGLQEECIVRLMFQLGLRLGETLGLTNDDIVKVKNENNWESILYLRNRFSDKPYQSAKTCMNVINRKQYNTVEYQKNGFEKIVFSNALYDILNLQICKTHEYVKEKYPENYLRCTIADRIRKTEPYEDQNRYIFLNEYGRPLSANSWNCKLRKIFIAAEIPIDSNVRQHNLSHRFRHGFAMYQVQKMGKNEIELMKLLRHSSLDSVKAYFKPTTDDQVNMKNEFEESLMESIPALRPGYSEQLYDLY